MNAPAVAADLLHYSVVMQTLQSSRRASNVCRVDCRVTQGAPDAKRSPAGAAVAAALESAPMNWMDLDTHRERYEAFCALGEAEKAALVAIAVSSTLDADTAREDGTVTQALVQQVGFDAARWWRPTASNYLKRITRAQLLAIGEELCGSEWKVKHAKDKKGVLVDVLDALFNDEAVRDSLNPKVRDRIDAWLPAEIRD